MLDGLFMLLSLSVVMALASFLAGAVPLSMSLSQSQLRLISAIGMGVLVGTSLIVIIPEGIEAVYDAESSGHSHVKRLFGLSRHTVDVRWAAPIQPRFVEGSTRRLRDAADIDAFGSLPGPVIPNMNGYTSEEDIPFSINQAGETGSEELDTTPGGGRAEHVERDPPTFYIGLSLVLGFVLMFLIDKLPRHASEDPAPPTRHISLNDLSQGLHQSQEERTEESESFLHSLTPNPKQSRSLATTTGLVIHAAADGIAMGASASTSNSKLGFIIFIAIMVHKAPAAFGLTSVLLKQGLSKRAARGHLIIFSLAAPFGALATWLLVQLLGAGDDASGETRQWWTGFLLLFSAGTFLYVAMHAMQDDASGHNQSSSNGYLEGNTGVQRKELRPQMRDIFAVVAGMLIPLLTQFGHHH